MGADYHQVGVVGDAEQCLDRRGLDDPALGRDGRVHGHEPKQRLARPGPGCPQFLLEHFDLFRHEVRRQIHRLGMHGQQRRIEAAGPRARELDCPLGCDSDDEETVMPQCPPRRIEG